MERHLFIVLVGLLAFFASPSMVIAQNAAETTYVSVDKEKGYNLKKRQFAIYSINHLKTGALLVMLHTRERAIKLYRDHNASKVADEIQADQDLENRRTMSAFKKNFTFCPVYFFFDKNMDDVKKGALEGIFLNDSLLPDRSIVLQQSFFMIADFSPLDEESFEFIQEGGRPSSIQSQSGERNLIIRDNYFVQMRSPFPYATSARISKNADRQVAKLTVKLFKYYDKQRSTNVPYPFSAKP